MMYWKTASAAAIAAGLAWAGPASADVTAKGVWESWKTLGQSYGQTITATEQMSGDTLTVSDITLSMTIPQGGSVTGTVGEITFTQRRDGTVAIEMSPEYPIRATTVSATGEALDMGMTVRQTGLSMIASGDADQTAYDFVAPQVAVTLDRALLDGAPMDMTLDMGMDRVTGKYTLTQGELRRIDTDLNADALRFDMSAVNPDDATRVAIAMTLEKLASTSVSALPADMQTSDLGKMLAAGFTSKGGLRHGAMTYRMDVTEDAGQSQVAATATGGTLDFDLGDGGMMYDVASTGTTVVLKGPQIPFPQVEIAMADSAFKMQMPLIMTEEPADFALLTRLEGLRISDQIWAMFDPTAQLPRDPATLIVDLAGKARWLVDVTDPTQANSDAAPGELHALRVNDLRLSLAGVDLSGEGAFTFDNADTTTFDGFPKPTGSLALRLVGANGLMDKLVAMGLIPQDQAMGMRMMLGMFARPGGGEDTMVSEITVTEGGQVLANGQRLR
ncbi:MAG: DUF2125 domain-containing protein [Rhodobacteraceae bacterium]|nr:DUF2125 domain-containing protein [Paracoccaceae bacterium]